MALESVKRVFENLNTGTEWSLQLLNVKNSEKRGTSYVSRAIILSPDEQLTKLINDIADIRLENEKKSLDSYIEVREYDGTADARVIYKLSTDDKLIATEYSAFVQAIGKPDVENKSLEYKTGYVLKGMITLDDEQVSVKLISMGLPVTVLKNKFSPNNNGTFKEIKEKVLSLNPTVDLVVVDKTVYFLNLAGENLFNMERSYKAVCEQKVEEVEQADIIYSIDEFKRVAKSRHNPRRFISFDEKKLEALKDKSMLDEIAKQFDIPLDPSGKKFNASIEGASDKIVKFLCNKGMVDPIERKAVEVDGAKQWR